MSEEIMSAEAAKPARTLEQVTQEIRYLDTQAKRLVLGHAIEIGRRLEEAKAMVPYGEWGNYISRELEYSQSTANNFMRIYNEYGAAQQSLFGPVVAESQTLGKLSYSKALQLLAVPREEREQFAQEVDAEHISTRELEAAIRERDEARKRAESAEDMLRAVNRDFDLSQEAVKEQEARLQAQEGDIRALTRELAELKARPVEVAVQGPDPDAVEKLAAELANKAKEELEQKAAKEVGAAEEKADKAAEALKKAKEKARAEREKLEAQLKEAEGKLAAAGAEDKAEVERLRAETEQLQKQLVMSGAETVIFKLRFSAWQDAYRLMTEAFAAIHDEETKAKLRTAINAQVEAWRSREGEQA